MARLTCALVLAALGCGKPVGLGGAATPLASIQVQVDGDAATAAATHLRVALVWGAEWLPEPFCFLPPESPAAATVQQAGCQDSLGFVPNLVAASVPVTPGVPTTIQLFDLPSADVMVGDITGRVAYGSLVLFDDLDDSGTLELRRSQPDFFDMDGGLPPDAAVFGGGGGVGGRRSDVVYGASFFSMSAPDLRLAYREGAFLETGFYPRSGCPDPVAGFSIVGAGGFSLAAAEAAALAGQLPPEDPATCSAAPLTTGVVTITAQDPSLVSQVACTRRNSDGIPRYRKPPGDMRDLGSSPWACVTIPNLDTVTSDAGAAAANQIQLVVSTTGNNVCKSVTHYVLRGCDNDPTCDPPSWDETASPPAWWPCPTP
jgi:hypothetical protein